jgi:5-methylcytosine-specific restriction endonuclease McrA/endogenous inhibitor of DNA gyrase (YacG/DUF329 family)
VQAEPTRTCKGCGTPLVKRERTGRWPVWCSRECERASHRIDPGATRPCRHCGKGVPRRSRSPWCSEDCKRADGQDAEVKQCQRCKRTLSLTAFHQDRSSPGGRASRCRECVATKAQARYAGSEGFRQRKAEQSRAWVARNPAEARRVKRRYYEENRERLLAEMAMAYRADPDIKKRSVAKWAKANPDRILEYQRHRRAKKKSRSAAPITSELLAGKLAYWGWACWLCGGEGPQAWDHVKPLSKGGAHVLANLRPAHLDCNSMKGSRWPFPLKGGHSWSVIQNAFRSVFQI